MSDPVYNVSVDGNSNDTDLMIQSAGASISDNGNSHVLEGRVNTLEKTLVLSGELDKTNVAVNNLQNDLQATQLSAKAQAALKNVLPLILEKEIKEPLDLITLGYTIKFFDNGNGIVIGAPNTTNPSENPTVLLGRIYVYKFINSNWYITNTITEDDLELYGYGRYVSCSDDGKLISQCNWAAETEYK